MTTVRVLDRTPHIRSSLPKSRTPRHGRRPPIVDRKGAPCEKHRDMDLDSDGAVEILRCGSSAIALITCEHASAEFPPPWTLPAEDSWLEGTHWTFDLGARALASELCETLETVGVLARFSRL